MSKNSAEFLNFEDWGIRKLSYDIKKLNRGKFILIHFSAKGSFIQELERNLKISDDCIRFQTVVYTQDIEPKKENKEEVVNEQISAEKNHRNRPYPEDIYQKKNMQILRRQKLKN